MAKSHSLHGLFAVHKPAGVTSASVTNQIKEVISQGLTENGKRKQGALKVGHGGTLDYNASGVLVIGVGKGTKALEKYLKGPKKYKAVGLLGKATDTHSEDGKLVEVLPHDHVTEDRFLQVLNTFQGRVKQIPPLYSALKFRGHTMASLVAAGFPVEPKPARLVTVYNIHCQSFQPPIFKIEITCGGGFYVRKLIHDIGKELGSCACMKALVRVQQGPFVLYKNVMEQDEWLYHKILESLMNIK